MPKNNNPQGIRVDVEISLPREGAMNAAVRIDPASTEFTDKPTLKQVKAATLSAVLDYIEVKNFECMVTLPQARDSIQLRLGKAYEAALESVVDSVRQAVADHLRVKVLDGRSVLAYVKAWQKKQREAAAERNAAIDTDDD